MRSRDKINIKKCTLIFPFFFLKKRGKIKTEKGNFAKMKQKTKMNNRIRTKIYLRVRNNQFPLLTKVIYATQYKKKNSLYKNKINESQKAKQKQMEQEIVYNLFLFLL